MILGIIACFAQRADWVGVTSFKVCPHLQHSCSTQKCEFGQLSWHTVRKKVLLHSKLIILYVENFGVRTLDLLQVSESFLLNGTFHKFVEFIL